MLLGKGPRFERRSHSYGDHAEKGRGKGFRLSGWECLREKTFREKK